jgi:thioredoxin 1
LCITFINKYFVNYIKLVIFDNKPLPKGNLKILKIIMALEITNDNFDSLLSENEVVVVDFWAPWCGPCRMMTPIIDELAEEFDTAIIGKANVDESTELAQKYGIRGIPTVVFFKDGEAVQRISGVKPKEEIEEIIKNL